MIELNNFKRQWVEIGPAVMAAVERVGASGWYILGKEVENFERELACYWGLSHCVGVGNGMDAIEIGLRCLDLQPGQKVLTTPFSAFATTLAIIRAGGVPVFVDVDGNGNIDLEQSRDVFARDRSMRFLVPVHLYGNPVDLDALDRLKRDFDLRVVEDCAQAIGARFGGRAVGSVGQVAATSFYPTKNLGAFGDGGALVTNDTTLASCAKKLRHYGQSSLYNHDELGLNSRLDELHAAVLTDALLPNLSRWTEARRQTAAAYLSGIKNPSLRMLQVSSGAEPVWHLFPTFTNAAKRSDLQAHFSACGIRTGIHYPSIIPDQAGLRLSRFDIAAEPTNARTLAQSELSLPINPYLVSAEIDQIVASCRHLPTST